MHAVLELCVLWEAWTVDRRHSSLQIKCRSVFMHNAWMFEIHFDISAKSNGDRDDVDIIPIIPSHQSRLAIVLTGQQAIRLSTQRTTSELKLWEREIAFWNGSTRWNLTQGRKNIVVEWWCGVKIRIGWRLRFAEIWKYCYVAADSSLVSWAAWEWHIMTIYL